MKKTQRKPRPTKHIIHFNRQREKVGLPWTVHNRGTCHAASHIEIHVPMYSEEKPQLKTNPRYFFTCKGYLHWDGSTAIITDSP
jgi:hypothetical protein